MYKYFIDKDSKCQGQVLTDNPVNPLGFDIVEYPIELEQPFKMVYVDSNFVFADTAEEEMQNEVRILRNAKIAETDWSQLDDIPEATKLLYKTYRQALRDITTQSGFPFNVVWPDKP